MTETWADNGDRDMHKPEQRLHRTSTSCWSMVAEYFFRKALWSNDRRMCMGDNFYFKQFVGVVRCWRGQCLDYTYFDTKKTYKKYKKRFFNCIPILNSTTTGVPSAYCYITFVSEKLNIPAVTLNPASTGSGQLSTGHKSTKRWFLYQINNMGANIFTYLMSHDWIFRIVRELLSQKSTAILKCFLK